jgi:hypothetical protein
MDSTVPFSHSCVLNLTLGHNTDTFYCTYERGCACVNGCRLVAEGIYDVLPPTRAANSNMSCGVVPAFCLYRNT